METNRKIIDLNGALAYQANQLFKAEKQLRDGLATCLAHVSSDRLSDEISKYVQSIDDKALKLERVFNYLLEEPSSKLNKVVGAMIEETHHVLELASSDAIRDAILISCLRSMISYKTAGYRNARIFALELELEVVSGILEDIIEWEQAADAGLTNLAVNEVNVP